MQRLGRAGRRAKTGGTELAHPLQAQLCQPGERAAASFLVNPVGPAPRNRHRAVELEKGGEGQSGRNNMKTQMLGSSSHMQSSPTCLNRTWTHYMLGNFLFSLWQIWSQEEGRLQLCLTAIGLVLGGEVKTEVTQWLQDLGSAPFLAVRTALECQVQQPGSTGTWWVLRCWWHWPEHPAQATPWTDAIHSISFHPNSSARRELPKSKLRKLVLREVKE